MKHSLKLALMAGVAIALAACQDNIAPSIITDAQLNADVAASAGDAAANVLVDMAANEGAAALPSSQPSFNLFGSVQDSQTVSYTRSRTCLDAGNAVVVNCTPLSSVKTVIFTFSVDGSRIGAYFTGKIHRAAVDTITRVAGSSGDSLRIHNGNGTASDTTTFDNATTSAVHYEAATDSARGITFWIPRSIHPFPTAGMFVRNVTVHASYTKNGTTVTRDVTRRVEVDFPADGQGNVVLKINALTCNLNLVTHHVSNCL